MNNELRTAQDIVREYSKRSKKDYYHGTSLKALYKALGQLRAFLDNHEDRVYVSLCSGCDAFNLAPNARRGWCARGKGYVKKADFCSLHAPRTEAQKQIDEYIRRRLENDDDD